MKKILNLLKLSFLFVVFSSLAYDYLPDGMSLSDALLIISHNSPQAKAYNWDYYQQLGNLRSQWNAGARGAKINLHWRLPESFIGQIAGEVGRKIKKGVLKIFGKKSEPKSDPKKEPFIGLCHEGDGTTNCLLSKLQKSGEIDKAEDHLREFAKLLQENPKDIAIIILEDYLEQRSAKNGADKYSSEQVKQKLHELLERSGLAKFAFKLGPEYTHKPIKKWPTIGELRKLNKRVLIFTDVREHAKDSNILHFVHDYIRQSHWEYNWEEDLKAGRCKLFDRLPDAAAFLIVHGTEISIPKGSKKGKVLDFLNKIKKLKAGHVPIKTEDYNYLNSKDVIKKRVEDCNKASTIYPVSMIKMDFVEIGDAKNAVKEINLERAKKLGLIK